MGGPQPADEAVSELIARATVPAFALDVHGRRVVAANEGLLTAVQRAADEVLGQPCVSICAHCPVDPGTVQACPLLIPRQDAGRSHVVMLRAGDGTLLPMVMGATRLNGHALYFAFGANEEASPQSGTVSIRALGGFEATLPSGRLIEPRRPQTITVLKRLLCPRGRIVSDAEFVATLWPEGAPARPRASLRALISDLRRALDPANERGGQNQLVTRSSPGYVVPPTAPIHIDFEAFSVATEAAGAAASANRFGEAEVQAEQALALYTGDLFEPDEAAPWFLPLRRRLRRQWVETLRLNAALLARRGDIGGAVRTAEIAVEADYVNEEAHRLLLLLTARHEGVAAAGSYFVDLFREFRARFGVAPSRKTAELMRRLDDGEPIEVLEREVLPFAS